MILPTTISLKIKNNSVFKVPTSANLTGIYTFKPVLLVKIAHTHFPHLVPCYTFAFRMCEQELHKLSLVVFDNNLILRKFFIISSIFIFKTK